MAKVGSPYLPFLTDTQLIEKFLDKNGDWKDLSQITIMYYAIRLLQIRYRLYSNMVTAPLPTQSMIQGAINKLDTALENINDVTSNATVVFSEVSIPNHLANHPYVNMLKHCLSKGMDIKRSIKTVSDQLDVPEKFIKNFLSENHIKLNDKRDEDSEAFKIGSKKGKDKSLKSDLLSILQEAKKSGYTSSEDVVNFIKGFCQTNHLVDFSLDEITTVSEGLNKLVKADFSERGKITSKLLSSINKIQTTKV